jgi:hypothetical protein
MIQELMPKDLSQNISALDSLDFLPYLNHDGDINSEWATPFPP